jgi:hypothetical protein
MESRASGFISSEEVKVRDWRLISDASQTAIVVRLTSVARFRNGTERAIASIRLASEGTISFVEDLMCPEGLEPGVNPVFKGISPGVMSA